LNDWRTSWSHLIRSADDAVRLVEPGDHLFMPFSHGQPPALVAALVEQRERFNPPVSVWTGAASFGSFEFAEERCAEFLQPRLVHPGRLTAAVAAGRAAYVPVDNVDLCRLLDQSIFPCDVVFVHVSPPDEAGDCSLGLSVGPALAMLQAARKVIAQVNPSMPRTFGESMVNMSRFDAVVAEEAPLKEWGVASSAVSPVERAVADNVAKLVPSGASVQTGIGSLADAILASIAGKRELRIRSGMISDGVLSLISAGAIATEGGAPTVRAGSALGTKDLYRWAHENPVLSMDSTETTHGGAASDRAFTAINSAVEVDLTGQANIEALGGKLIGGVGGQLRFMLAAGESPGGRSILALPSVSRDGKHSRIRARLTDVPIGTPRSAIHFIVTDQGIADLQGRTLEERVDAVLAVSHPRFRDTLRSSLDRAI